MFACLYIPDFPVAALLRTQPEAQARAQTALLDCAHAFSPRVEARAADTVLLDIAGLERLFGPPAKVARELAQRASSVGLEANVAVAANPEAALHAARGFAGVTVIPPGQEAARLGELRVDVLAPPAEILETLDRWGVRTLRALAALPEVAVTERLGQSGLALQRLARGEGGARPLVPVEPPLEFEEAIELEHPVTLLEPLAFLLSRLLEPLCARLAARALAAQEIVLNLYLTQSAQRAQRREKQVPRLAALARDDNGGGDWDDKESVIRNDKAQDLSACSAVSAFNDSYQRRLRLPVPMLDARVFLKLLQLELAAHPPGAPVVKIVLRAQPARPRPGQAGLWLPATPPPEKLEVMLARLARLVAAREQEEMRVGSPELLDTHAPCNFRMRRFTAGSGDRKPKAVEVAGPHITMPLLGLRLFRPPLSAEVELRDSAPARVRFQKTSGEVAWRSGPWRASGEWWTGRAWAREEWDVAITHPLAAGCSSLAWYRLVHDSSTGEWFVEGMYD